MCVLYYLEQMSASVTRLVHWVGRVIQSLASVSVDMESVALSAIAAVLTSGVFHKLLKETADVCVISVLWSVFLIISFY